MSFESWLLVNGVLLLLMALAYPLIARLLITTTVVALSILAHGVSVTPLLNYSARVIKRAEFLPSSAGARGAYVRRKARRA